jgi:putative membrane-bound dehydrogenase-like protein
MPLKPLARNAPRSHEAKMEMTPLLTRILSRVGESTYLLAILVYATLAQADSPPVYNSEQSTEKPISGEEATSKIKLPDGFKANLFASEPMVRNPIALQYDGQGRLWIAENFSYAERGLRLDPNLRDKIVILSDQDHDGKADSSNIFTDQLHNLTGFAIGRGGVWAICPPQLLFIPDSNQDDKPDSPPVVVLDGFNVPLENHHNFANGLKFGPDGWLYGRAGGSSPSEVGIPGTPDIKRIPLRGGIWRYHTQTNQFEVLTHGTTNPWGMDWDAHGEMFFVNTVNGHLWHLIPGAHLMRLHTIDPNPLVYQMIDTNADHYHFDTGQGWVASRDGAANHLGGGHAHQGTLIYQGGRWAESFNGKLLTINFHGRRINSEKIELTSNGYIGRHEPDFALFGDTWFRGLDMAHCPDGNIAVIDWSDTGECHENTGVHRSSGRIYLLQDSTSSSKPVQFHSFNKSQTISELKSVNIYEVRRALQAIADKPDDFISIVNDIHELASSRNSTVHRLRGIWALFTMGQLSEKQLIELTYDPDEHIRTWALRLIADKFELDTIMGDRRSGLASTFSEVAFQRFLQLAESEKSILVKLALASSLQRMPVDNRRARLAEKLASQPIPANHEMVNQTTLPLLVWYGISPLTEKDPSELIEVLKFSKWPVLDQMIARSISAQTTADQPNVFMNQMTSWASDKPVQKRNSILAGMNEGLAGRDKALTPDGWNNFIDGLNPDQTLMLHALFGEGIAIDQIKAIVADSKAEMQVRINALRTLIKRRPDDIVPFCTGLLGTRFLNTEALAGLRSSSDTKVAEALIRNYRSFSLQDRPKIIDLLCQRPEWAVVLLKSVGENRLPKEEISVIHARQLLAIDNSQINELLRINWGEIKPQSQASKDFTSLVRNELKSAELKPVDFNFARKIYLQSCGQCHTLYGEGGRLGPDITGAQRQNLDYLLENITEPSAAVSPDFRVTNVALKDGRILAGLVRPRDKQSITLITPTETMIIARESIEAERQTPASIMPDGQLEAMKPAERVALLRYLMTEQPPALKPND